MFDKNKFRGWMGNEVAFKGGSYSLVISAVVLAILIVINIMVSALPSNLTKFDMSATKLYSITSDTKVVVNSLEKDVDIYWIVQADEEDSVIENLLAKYESLSSHLTVTKKNPDVYPTFAEQYTNETVKNNSLVVACGDVYRYIPYEDIYLSDIDYTTYSYVYSFDGEGAITSAIRYVVSDELPKVYLLEGHGEDELSSSFAEKIKKANYETETLSLLTLSEVPDDADCVIINGPSSDISEAEKELLADYVAEGGSLLVFAGPISQGSLTNLNALLGDYGVTVEEGVVVEADGDHYASSMPYLLIPDIETDDITSSLIDENYYVMVPIANGLMVGSATNGYVTPLLTSSEKAYCKTAGLYMETYDKEEEDIDGPFQLGVSILTSGGGQLVWFASEYLTDDNYNAYSSGANVELAMNALSSLVGETEALQISSKSLSYNYLTITDSAGANLKFVMIGLIPLAFLGAGIDVVIRRRRKKNEQV